MTRIAPHSRQNYCTRTSNNYTVLLRTLHIEILVCVRIALGVVGKTMKESTSNEAFNVPSSSFTRTSIWALANKTQKIFAR